MKYLFKCRRNVIQEWLVYLKKNNHHYKDVTIDENLLLLYPEDDIPRDLTDSITVHFNPSSVPFTFDTGVAEDVHTYTENYKNLEQFQTSYALDNQNEEINSESILEYCANEQSQSQEVIAIIAGTEIINIQSNEFFAIAMPWLYPNGIGSRTNDKNIRIISVTKEQEIKHLLSVRDDSFRTNFMFQCIYYNTILKEQYFRGISYTMKSMSTSALDQFANITQEDLSNAIQDRLYR